MGIWGVKIALEKSVHTPVRVRPQNRVTTDESNDEASDEEISHDDESTVWWRIRRWISCFRWRTPYGKPVGGDCGRTSIQNGSQFLSNVKAIGHRWHWRSGEGIWIGRRERHSQLGTTSRRLSGDGPVRQCLRRAQRYLIDACRGRSSLCHASIFLASAHSHGGTGQDCDKLQEEGKRLERQFQNQLSMNTPLPNLSIDRQISASPSQLRTQRQLWARPCIVDRGQSLAGHGNLAAGWAKQDLLTTPP